MPPTLGASRILTLTYPHSRDSVGRAPPYPGNHLQYGSAVWSLQGSRTSPPPPAPAVARPPTSPCHPPHHHREDPTQSPLFHRDKPSSWHFEKHQLISSSYHPWEALRGQTTCPRPHNNHCILPWSLPFYGWRPLKVDKDFHPTKKNQNLKDYHFDTFRNKV